MKRMCPGLSLLFLLVCFTDRLGFRHEFEVIPLSDRAAHLAGSFYAFGLDPPAPLYGSAILQPDGTINAAWRATATLYVEATLAPPYTRGFGRVRPYAFEYYVPTAFEPCP